MNRNPQLIQYLEFKTQSEYIIFFYKIIHVYLNKIYIYLIKNNCEYNHWDKNTYIKCEFIEEKHHNRRRTNFHGNRFRFACCGGIPTEMLAYRSVSDSPVSLFGVLGQK